VDLHEASVFAGTKSGKDYDKFHECKLTAKEASKINAPMIEECPISLECRTTQVVNVGSHDLFIAEVLAVHIDETLLDENGRFDTSKASLFTYLPLGAEYWTLGEKIE
jgi:flavin reductase (DIM6/NTAB) family NADH-FMN oxidoreductase RutF